jgi:hypothetical protein
MFVTPEKNNEVILKCGQQRKLSDSFQLIWRERLTIARESGAFFAASQTTGILKDLHTSGISPSILAMPAVRRYVAVPFLMEPGMQTETHKKAVVGVFLNRSALSLLLLPVALFLWALHAYPPQYAFWLGFAAVIYIWPIAGVLFVIAAGFHVRPAGQRLGAADEHPLSKRRFSSLH